MFLQAGKSDAIIMRYVCKTLELQNQVEALIKCLDNRAKVNDVCMLEMLHMVKRGEQETSVLKQQVQQLTAAPPRPPRRSAPRPRRY